MPPFQRVMALMLLIAMLGTIIAVPAGAEEAQGDIGPIHLNMKKDETLSPEVVSDPYNEAERRQPTQSHTSTPGSLDCLRQKDWVTIGTWTSPAVVYDVSLGGSALFNLWWWEDDQPSSCPTDTGDGYDAQAEFRWTLKLNGQNIATHTTGENDASEPTEVTGSSQVQNTSHIARGENLELLIEYRAFEKIFYYLDNFTYQSGVHILANAVIPLAAEGRSSSVTLELAQAWPVNLQEALDGQYITATMKGEFADNELAEIEEGREYQVNNATIKSEAITWNTPYPGQATVSFSYAPNGTVDPVMIEVVTIPGKEEEGGFRPGLGFGGALIALASVSIYLSKRRR